MWYLIETFKNEQGEVTGRKVMGKGPIMFGAKMNQENTWSAEDYDINLIRVALDENDQPIRDEQMNYVFEEDPDAVAAKNQEAEIALRIKRIQFGQRMISIMSIRNDAKNLTPSEIVELVATFQTVNTAWLNGSIATSRAIIDAITPDGVLITASDKTAILAEIDANLVALGYEP